MMWRAVPVRGDCSVGTECWGATTCRWVTNHNGVKPGATMSSLPLPGTMCASTFPRVLYGEHPGGICRTQRYKTPPAGKVSHSTQQLKNRMNGTGISMNSEILRQENKRYENTCAISQNSGTLGFRPAFKDEGTGYIHISCFADGRPAPIHLLDGLPEQLVEERDPSGHVVRAKATIVSGFELQGRFYSREEAALLRG